MTEIRVRKASRLLVAMVASLAGPLLFVSGLGAARAGTSNAHAPSSQPAWANRGPAVAPDENGLVHAAWENTNGQLVVALRDTSGNWTIHNLGFGPLGSQPAETSTLQDTNNQNWHYVFWSGKGDSALNMAYWGNSTACTACWNGPVTIPHTADMVPKEPTATLVNGFGLNALIYVFWAGADNNVDYMWSSTPFDTSTWNGPFEAVFGSSNTAIGPVVGAPAAAGNCNNNIICRLQVPVYWTKDKKTITRAFWDRQDTSWTTPVTDSNINNLGSEPSAVADFFGQQSTVTWRGSGGSADLFIITDSYGATPFSNPDDTGAGPLASAPAVALNGADVSSAQWFYVWRGTNADLWTMHSVTGGFSAPFDVGGQICPGPQC